jgi:hypothetical protein
VKLHVSGTSVKPLRISFSDSKSHTSLPSLISFTARRDGHRQSRRVADNHFSPSLTAGSYMLLAKVTDGLIYRSVYVTATVT